jgi:hypothetical protein
MLTRHCALWPALLLSACVAPGPAFEGPSLDWLSGCWHLERENGAYEEMWLPEHDDGMIGAARELRGPVTKAHEFLRIERREGGELVYLARPSGQAAVEFPAYVIERDYVAFENPRHDFPTRIEYRYVDPNAVTARISGGGRVVEYPMQRMDCIGG